MYQSPLHDFHVSAGAKLIDFAGWNMPVHYRGITEEHVHTRTKVSAFDVSHMGRIRINGPDAAHFIDHLCTRDLSKTQVGQSKYTHVCRPDGGILDDVIVSRKAAHWYVVCNASNRKKIVSWLQEHASGRDIALTDETFDTAMIAIQGPLAIGLMAEKFGLDLAGLKRYWCLDGEVMGFAYSVARSGYTGEDGVEAVIPSAAVELVLPLLFGDVDDPDQPCKPAGLGARDTLRTEAAMPLYGHELSEAVDSLTAGQGWCVDLDTEFVGARALREIQAAGFNKTLVGLELEGKRIARQGYAILRDGAPVGEITSGTMSPTLGKSIAMGFVQPAAADVGTRLSVDLGRKQSPARVVPLPFYQRPKS